MYFHNILYFKNLAYIRAFMKIKIENFDYFFQINFTHFYTKKLQILLKCFLCARFTTTVCGSLSWAVKFASLRLRFLSFLGADTWLWLAFKCEGHWAISGQTMCVCLILVYFVAFFWRILRWENFLNLKVLVFFCQRFAHFLHIKKCLKFVLSLQLLKQKI
jgi:hypothetical protein